MELWELVKVVLQFAVLPACGVVAWLYKDLKSQIEIIIKHQSLLELKQAVQEEKMINLKEDLEEIKKLIRQVLSTVNRASK